MDFSYSMLLLKESNRVQHSWEELFQKNEYWPTFFTGSSTKALNSLPTGFLGPKFLSLEPTPLQGWESLPCSSRPTARGRGGLQMQTGTCRVGSAIAENPGQAGRQPWALLQREAAGSGGRRKLSCWQAPPLFHFPGGQADVNGWIFPDSNGCSNRIRIGDNEGSHFLSVFFSFYTHT